MVSDPERKIDLQAVRMRLRQRAHRKALRAGRIGRLRILGYSHEQARERLELPVEHYHRAKRWLLAAAYESESSEELLTLDEALRRYAERHVEGVVRLGLLRERGARRSDAQQQLGISDMEYEVGWAWWRDALAGHVAEQ